MGSAYVYVQYITGTCIRADIYIFLMLLRLAVHICIRARYITGICIRAKIYIYIMAYHLLLDSTKPYSGKPPHRASHGQA